MEVKRFIEWSGLHEFANKLKLGKFQRSYHVAEQMIAILIKIVDSDQWSTVRDLLNALKIVCVFVMEQQIVETAAGNIVRRVMRLVRDECLNCVPQEHRISEETDSIDREDKDNKNLDLPMGQVRANITDAITELKGELELSSSSIAKQSLEHIQSDEIIMTLGSSRTIESFLKHAVLTGKRKFTVIVVELAPFYSGRNLAANLEKVGISTLVIPDSALFAVMSRVNKVIIGTHSMMANGGIKAPAGAYSLALAANHYSVPLIVCCPLFKLTPEYLVSHDAIAFDRFSSVYRTVPSFSDTAENTTETINCIFDHVPPELITLFVSDKEGGGNSPSYVYQLLNELYCKLDYL